MLQFNHFDSFTGNVTIQISWFSFSLWYKSNIMNHSLKVLQSYRMIHYRTMLQFWPLILFLLMIQISYNGSLIECDTIPRFDSFKDFVTIAMSNSIPVTDTICSAGSFLCAVTIYLFDSISLFVSIRYFGSFSLIDTVSLNNSFCSHDTI